MKNKVLSSIMAISMLLGSSTVIFAENEPEWTPDPLWNYRLIEPGSEDIYAEFPFITSKLKAPDMGMNIQLAYLKNIGENDEVSLTVTDCNTDEVVLEEDLTAQKSAVVLNDVDDEGIYHVYLSETLGGNTNTYDGYIETIFVESDMPINITLGNNEINKNFGETVSGLKYRKVGAVPCEHEDPADCTDECEDAKIHIVDPDDYDTFYDDLDEDCYYEIQASVLYGEHSEVKYGYISTYPGGEDRGIFTRSFRFRKTLPNNNVQGPRRISPAGTNADPTVGDPTGFLDEIQNYQYYENKYMDFSVVSEYNFKFIPPATGTYTFEVIGNSNVVMYFYEQVNGQWKERTILPSNSNNPSTIRSWYVGNDSPAPTVYISVVRTISSGNGAFRVIRASQYNNGDEFPNTFDAYETESMSNVLSNATNLNCFIDYNGDVDVFKYESNTGNGYVNLIMNDQHEGNLVVQVFSRDTSIDVTQEEPWFECEVYDNEDEVPTAITIYEPITYLVVKKKLSVMPPYGSNAYFTFDDEYCAYSLLYYDPKKPDAYEYIASETYSNNYPQHATPITTVPLDNDGRYYFYGLTLHKGDSDFFTFTTTNSQTSVIANVSRASGLPMYLLTLIDDSDVTTNGQTYSSYNVIKATGVINNSNNTLTYHGLLPNHKYYLKVQRPNNNTYNVYYPYTLSVKPINGIPTAVLNQNVNLSHTAGNNISSLDGFMQSIMNSMVCSINGDPVDSDVASEFVTLYYNNSELTYNVVNSLQPGIYNIVPKYRDVPATGGTVTLTVTGNVQEEIAELTNVPTEATEVAEMDWIVCAKMAANVRRLRENMTATTIDVWDALYDLDENADFEERGTKAQTVTAAKYFYLNGTGTSGNNFVGGTVNLSTAETTLYTTLNNGKSVIMLLTDVDDSTDMSLARYVLLCGVNKTTHKYKIYDPVYDSMSWVNISTIHNGGYQGNNDLIFTGKIIEAQ